MSDIFIQSGQAYFKSVPPPEFEHSSFFDLFHILRIIFYILVVAKLIQLSFMRRKKHSLKERVYRKFLFAHQELLKQFTEEDRANMEHTLNNTIKNATVDRGPVRVKNTNQKKRVNFIIEKNNYYDPKQWKNDIEDEDLYLDVDDTAVSKTFFDMIKEKDTHGKMLEEEFGERQDLEKINEKEEEIEIEASKLTQQTQPSSIIRPNDASQLSELPIETKDSLLTKEPPNPLPSDEAGDPSELLLSSTASKKAV